MVFVHPPNFPKPRGYSNGVIAEGRTLYIAGQIVHPNGGAVMW